MDLTFQFSDENLSYYLSNLSISRDEDAINHSYSAINIRTVFLLLVSRFSTKISHDIVIITKDILSP